MAISEIIAALTLPGTERSARRARAFARDVLGEGHPSLPDVELCVNEAVANGVEHTRSGRGGRVTVMFSRAGDDIMVEVVDDGADGTRPELNDDPLAEHGRGLQIIDAIALEWGVRADGARTAVWMRFPGPPPQPSRRPARARPGFPSRRVRASRLSGSGQSSRAVSRRR